MQTKMQMTETKTNSGTIKQVRENIRNYEAHGKTIYVHAITLDAPQRVEGESVAEFNYHSQSPVCTKFTPGESRHFATEKRTFGQNGIEYKIAPVEPPNSPFNNQNKTGKRFEDRDAACITALSVLSSVMTGYQQSEFVMQRDRILEDAEFFYAWVKSKRGDFSPNF